MLRYMFLVPLCAALFAHAQIQIFDNPSTTSIAELLAGPGAGIEQVEPPPCTTGRIGQFQGTSSLGINSGIVIATGPAQDIIGPNDYYMDMGGTPFIDLQFEGEDDLRSLMGDHISPSTFLSDGCQLTMDVLSLSDTLYFDFIYASEEYQNGFECTHHHMDPMGLFVSGPGLLSSYADNAVQIAVVPGSDSIPVNINTINAGMVPTTGNSSILAYPPWDLPPVCADTILGPWCECLLMDPGFADHTPYYVYNGLGFSDEAPYGTDPFHIALNGHTTVLTARVPVQPEALYRVRVVVANTSDWRYGSAVFLPTNRFPYGDGSVGLAEVAPPALSASFVDEVLVVTVEGAEGSYASVLDATGRLVDSFRITGSRTEQSMGHARGGLYFVHIPTSHGPLVQRVFKP
jgi:hypothetical protein